MNEQVQPRRSVALTIVVLVGTAAFIVGTVMQFLHINDTGPTVLDLPYGIKVQIESVATVVMVLGFTLVLGTLIIIARTPSISGRLYGRSSSENEQFEQVDEVERNG